jgi:hypothetical protein
MQVCVVRALVLSLIPSFDVGNAKEQDACHFSLDDYEQPGQTKERWRIRSQCICVQGKDKACERECPSRYCSGGLV